MEFAAIFANCGKDPTRVADTLGIPLPEVFRRMKELGLKSGHRRTPGYYKRVITEYRDEYLFHSLGYISKKTGISTSTLWRHIDESHDIVARMPINRPRGTPSASQDPCQQAAIRSDVTEDMQPGAHSKIIIVVKHDVA